jgi:hypothetical protein
MASGSTHGRKGNTDNTKDLPIAGAQGKILAPFSGGTTSSKDRVFSSVPDLPGTAVGF